MKRKNYSSNPLQVRLHTITEESLNNLIQDNEYCQKKNIISKSDAVRSALFNFCKDYESYKFNKLNSL
jgi:hypothetical protein|tara:strand:- start:237 stop:440 length:204 start_codon:yes stop_codon:yes gene_type:complete